MNVRSSLVILGAIVTALFLIMAFSPLSSVLARAMMVEVRLEPAAAIVVLGGAGARGDGTLTDSSLRRTLHGIHLYRQGLAPRLLFSGSISHRGHREAEIRASLAREVGVPPTVILTESRAHTTREEAMFIAARLLPMGARRILLVSDAQGARRAHAIFERAGFEVLAAPAEDVPRFDLRPQERLRLMRRVVMEMVAWLYYQTAGYV